MLVLKRLPVLLLVVVVVGAVLVDPRPSDLDEVVSCTPAARRGEVVVDPLGESEIVLV